MNLSLHYDRSAYPLCNLPCLLFRVRDLTARNPHVIARQNLLGLVFVYLHDCLKKNSRQRKLDNLQAGSRACQCEDKVKPGCRFEEQMEIGPQNQNPSFAFLERGIVVSGRTYVKSMSPRIMAGIESEKTFHTPCNLYACRLHLYLYRLHSRERSEVQKPGLLVIYSWDRSRHQGRWRSEPTASGVEYGNDFERPGH